MFKKIMSAVLATAMVTSMSVMAFAYRGSSYDYIDLNEENFIETNELYVQKGKEVLSNSSNITSNILNVPHYYQDGQSWSDDLMKKENSSMDYHIAYRGSTLTSFSMIQRYLGGNLNPGEVNAKLGYHAFPFLYNQVAEDFGYNVLAFSDLTTVYEDDMCNFIVGAIKSGHPVLVGLKKETRFIHFVTAYGYDENGILIHDPSSKKDCSTLDEYLGDRYSINRVCVFGK